MSKEPTKPSESLVQQLLAERRELKVTVERLRLELAEAKTTAGGPDPRLRDRADRRNQPVDDDRGESERELVNQDVARLGDERLGEHHHLLLAT